MSSKKTRSVAVHYKRPKKDILSLSKENIQKAKTTESQPTTPSIRMGEVGTSGLSLIESFVDIMMPYELSWPRILDTIEDMKKDDAVSIVLGLDEKLVQKAFSNYKIKYNKKSKTSKAAMELLRNNLMNLEGQTLEDVITHAVSIDAYGFSILEKVFKKQSNTSKYGQYRLLKLANRPQRSLSTTEPWTYTNKGRKLLRFNQNPNYFRDSNSQIPSAYPFGNNLDGSVALKRNKCLLFGFGASDSTPMGKSPLVGIYKAWKEKSLLEDLEVVGTTKDLAGLLEIKIPADILNKAAMNPTGPEAESLGVFKTNAANAHAGEASYVVIPSDTTDRGDPLYAMTLKGVEGAGKQFDTQALIETRRKAIFNAFGAGNVIVGDSGAGSYALSEAKNAMHVHYIDALIRRILIPLNRDLIPQFLQLNDIELSFEDMITIEAGPVEELDADTLSKVIQRVKAVNALPMTKDIIISYMDKLGFDVDHLEDMPEDQLLETLVMLEDGDSKSGTGMESGMNNGQGGKTGASGGDSKSSLIKGYKDLGESIRLSDGTIWFKEDLQELRDILDD